MAHTAPERAAGRYGGCRFRTFTAADLEELTTRAGLAPESRLKIRAAAAILGFGVTSYVTGELIDWSAAPGDPIYRLVFPDENVLAEADLAPITDLLRRDAPDAQIEAAAQWLRERHSPGHGPSSGEEILPGVYRACHATVHAVVPTGQAGPAFGTTCPGRTWPAAVPGPVMAAASVGQLVSYLAGHPEVTSVRFAGGDPLTLGAAALRRYIEPLLRLEQLDAIQLSTSALARWPYRFLTDPGGDADDTLRLFEQVPATGKVLALMAAFSHPRELEPAPVIDAVRRIRGTGAVIRTEAPLIGSVNDAASIWAAMWRTQARMGMVPHAMIIEPVTGPAQRFTVPLGRAHEIFAGAYGHTGGLGRTVRGPIMRDAAGAVCLDGTAGIGSEKVFVLHFTHARDPDLIGEPFPAAYDPGAAWLTDLKPVPGSRFPLAALTSRARLARWAPGNGLVRWS